LFERNWNEKIENSEKYFGSLSKRCKTKKSEGAKCKRHKNIGENYKIPGDARVPPHILIAPPLKRRLEGCRRFSGKYYMVKKKF
jgi:hypothetical protein